jgi:glycine/D-amino acid oxidase-like deaminating enzyme
MPCAQLGRVAPGLVVATGFDRHGVLLTPLAAELGGT